MTAAPGPRRWTRAEYHRLGELGFFDGDRVERLDGQIVVSGRLSWPHVVAMTVLFEHLRSVWTGRFWVRSRFPLELGADSDPEPDVSAIVGRMEDYTGHPTTAALVVEVSDSTLAVDRGPKQRLYAAAGIPEYWIVNLPDRQLEVYRRPEPAGRRRAAARRPGGVAVADLFG